MSRARRPIPPGAVGARRARGSARQSAPGTWRVPWRSAEGDGSEHPFRWQRHAGRVIPLFPRPAPRTGSFRLRADRKRSMPTPGAGFLRSPGPARSAARAARPGSCAPPVPSRSGSLFPRHRTSLRFRCRGAPAAGGRWPGDGWPGPVPASSAPPGHSLPARRSPRPCGRRPSP